MKLAIIFYFKTYVIKNSANAVVGNFNNDLQVCNFLRCYTGVIQNGVCVTGGNGWLGY